MENKKPAEIARLLYKILRGNYMVLPSYESVKDECLPLIGFDKYYVVHPDLGKIYSKVSNRWLLSNNPKGVGDKGYLQTKLKNNDNNSEPVYEHEAVMAAIQGIPVKIWRTEGLYGRIMEIDHDDRNVKNNSQSNLNFVERKNQYKPDVLKDMAQRGKLSKELAVQIRQDFKKWTGRKVKFYEAKAIELNVCKRSIQNIILGKSFKEVV